MIYVLTTHFQYILVHISQLPVAYSLHIRVCPSLEFTRSVFMLLPMYCTDKSVPSIVVSSVMLLTQDTCGEYACCTTTTTTTTDRGRRRRSRRDVQSHYTRVTTHYQATHLPHETMTTKRSHSSHASEYLEQSRQNNRNG